jgi:phosphatidylinositol alpha-1,6-mannosyltransferase
MKKNRKVLLITNDFYPSRGGIQETIIGLAGSFSVNTTVLAPCYPNYDMTKDNKFSFSVVRTNGLRQDREIDKLLFIFFRRPLIFFIRTFFIIIRIPDLRRFSFVICGHITTLLIGLFVKQVAKIPVGVVVHGKECFYKGILKELKYAVAKFLINRIDFIFLSNSFIRNKLIDMGIAQNKIVTIPFGVNFDEKVPVLQKKERKEKKEGKIILTVGRLVERKGHSYVIHALPDVLEKFPSVSYQIVGKGNMEHKLENLVREKGLEKYVEFYGEVDNLTRFYRNCDIFVMPSRFVKETGDVEGFGLVFLEANYFSKPVIAGRSGGISDAVIDGETGFLVDPENSQEIADTIIKLLDNPELARKLGEQGRKRVVEEFTWRKAAEIIEEKMSDCKVRENK